MDRIRVAAYNCGHFPKVCSAQIEPGRMGKALRIASIVGTGAAAVSLAFLMVWIMSR